MVRTLRRFLSLVVVLGLVWAGVPALVSAGPLSLITRAAHAPQQTPIYDNFDDAANTQLTGRKTTTGNQTWSAIAGSSSPAATASLKTTGTGEMYATGSQAAFSAGVITPGFTAQQWVRTCWSPYANSTTAPQIFVAQDLTYVGSGTGGTNLNNKIVVAPTSAISNGTNLRGLSGTNLAMNATPTSRDSAALIQWQPGDCSTARWYYSPAGTLLVDLYQNGRIVLHGAHDYSADSITLNGNVGFTGAISGTITKREIDSLLVADPTQHCVITLDRPTRVAQLATDGSLDLKLAGEYTCNAPGRLTFTLYSIGASALSVVSGYDHKVIQNLKTSKVGAGVGASGVWSGEVHVNSGDLPGVTNGYQFDVQRRLRTGDEVTVRSGVERQGEVLLTYGQSLMQLAWADGAFTPPTACGYFAHGSLDNASGTDAVARRTQAAAASGSGGVTAPSLVNGVFAAASGLACSQTMVVQAGKGGTCLMDGTTNDREVGQGTFAALSDGLLRAGNNAQVIVDNGFQFETQDSCNSTFAVNSTLYLNEKAQLNLIMTTLEQQVGHTMKMVLTPMSAIYQTGVTGSDVRAQAARRLVWELSQESPSRFILGAPQYDINHGSNSDTFHPTTNGGFDELNRRYAWDWAFARGYDSNNHMGPQMASVSRPDGTHVAITFTNVMDGIGFGGAAGSGGDSFRASLTFDFTDGTFTHQVSPSGQCVVSSTTVITCPFSGGQPAGTVWVRGPYGQNPANRANDATINTNLGPPVAGGSQLGSWICATRSGEICIPLHSFFSNSGAGGSAQDWLSGWIFALPLVRRRKTANDNATIQRKAA